MTPVDCDKYLFELLLLGLQSHLDDFERVNKYSLSETRT